MPQHDSLTRTQQMVRAAALASAALAVCSAPAVGAAPADARACADQCPDPVVDHIAQPGPHGVDPYWPNVGLEDENLLQSPEQQQLLGGNSLVPGSIPRQPPLGAMAAPRDSAAADTDEATLVADPVSATMTADSATDIADLADNDLEDLVSAIDPADLASVIDPAPLASVLDNPEQLLSALTDQVSTGDADTSTLQQLLAVVLPGFRMAPRLIARAIVPPNQFDAFDNIITHESGWNMFAINPRSGAYGLPQALPAFKMFSHGLDWPFNPITQIRWAYDYMNERYGSPNAAWAFWQAHHWY